MFLSDLNFKVSDNNEQILSRCNMEAGGVKIWEASKPGFDFGFSPYQPYYPLSLTSL
jgi:hypothetical protein